MSDKIVRMGVPMGSYLLSASFNERDAIAGVAYSQLRKNLKCWVRTHDGGCWIVITAKQLHGFWNRLANQPPLQGVVVAGRSVLARIDVCPYGNSPYLTMRDDSGNTLLQIADIRPGRPWQGKVITGEGGRTLAERKEPNSLLEMGDRVEEDLQRIIHGDFRVELCRITDVDLAHDVAKSRSAMLLIAAMVIYNVLIQKKTIKSGVGG